MVDFRQKTFYHLPMEFKRHILPHLEASLKDTPATIITGPRQSGKSTLAAQLNHKSKRDFLTLDNLNLRNAAINDPHAFINGLSKEVTLDEIQRAPELFLAIKQAIDENRQPGRFLLTGSANILLLPAISDSLAGRLEILNLWPLSQGEILGTQDDFIDRIFEPEFQLPNAKAVSTETLIKRLVAGGYPEVLSRTSQTRREAWFSSYLTTILERDVRDLTHITKLSELPNLLNLLAHRAGNLMNYAELSRSTGLTQTTLKRYLTLLEMTFLVYRLPAWAKNPGKRLVKSPKLLLCDSGLLSYLNQLDFEGLHTNKQKAGHLFENFVAMELIKQRTWSRHHPNCYHYRTDSGHEVDIVLENRKLDVVGIEVKLKSTLSEKDLVGLKSLKEQAGDKFLRGVIFYTGKESFQFTNELYALPISTLWGEY